PAEDVLAGLDALLADVGVQGPLPGLDQGAALDHRAGLERRPPAKVARRRRGIPRLVAVGPRGQDTVSWPGLGGGLDTPGAPRTPRPNRPPGPRGGSLSIERNARIHNPGAPGSIGCGGGMLWTLRAEGARGAAGRGAVED